MAAVAILWSVSWLFIGVSVALDPTATFIFAALGIGIFALGEMIWSTVGPTLTNVLAPEHLRGRYNSVDGLIWVFAGAVGPAVSGVMLQHKLVGGWIGMIMAGQLLACVFALRLKGVLTPAQDGTSSL
jgi:hypothetical protein